MLHDGSTTAGRCRCNGPLKRQRGISRVPGRSASYSASCTSTSASSTYPRKSLDTAFLFDWKKGEEVLVKIEGQKLTTRKVETGPEKPGYGIVQEPKIVALLSIMSKEPRFKSVGRRFLHSQYQN